MASLPRDVPGLEQLKAEVDGLPLPTIAVIDGMVDVSHPVFDGADLVALPGAELSVPAPDDPTAAHATHVASVLFGQPGSPVEGIVPRAHGIVVPIFDRARPRVPQLEIARAIERALEAGAQIINLSGGEYVDSGVADDFLQHAMAACEERGALLVAAAGNDGCDCLHVPAALQAALAVGALGEDGSPMEISNWGEAYLANGILALGENVLGAVPDGRTGRATGTSVATPVVTGVAALLAAREAASGRPCDLGRVRRALLDGALPCTSDDEEHCRRLIGGVLDIHGAMAVLDKEVGVGHGTETETETAATGAAQDACGCGGVPPQLAALMPDQTAAGAGVGASAVDATAVADAGIGASSPPPSPTTVPQGAQVDTSQDGSPMTPARPQLVYAIGKLGYDFGTEARRDSFKQLMDPVVVDNVAVPANPYDSRQMVAHLDRYPSEAQALIWTLNLELTPLYAIVPIGPFAGDVYQSLRRLLEGEIQAPDADEFVDRLSLPGRMSDRQVRLFSGQVVPVVEVDTTRGLYGWRTNWLTTNAVEHVKSTGRDVNAADVEEALGGFLNRVYYDMRNIGVLSRDRALNFAATNAFQAASAFAEALAIGMHLDDIQVEPSPYARQDADAWDVKLKFFDPENLRRARRVFRFTVDVSDSMPVTLGDVRTWSTSS